MPHRAAGGEVMGQIIFCKTRFQGEWQGDRYVGGYQSYSDLWRLVEWAGYPIIYVDQLDPQSDNTYIITPLNDEWLAGWQNPKAQIIHYELEWRWDERANWKEPEGVSRVWHIDPWFAKEFDFEYVPVGSDDRLCVSGRNVCPEPYKDCRYDVAIMSYQTPRRQAISATLENLGLRLAPLGGLWGMDRSLALDDSHCMVHVHQNDNAPGIASLRWAIAAAHHLPLITETVRDRGIYGYSCMVQSDYEYLAQFTRHMLADRTRLKDYGESLHNLLCVENTFKKVIEAHV